MQKVIFSLLMVFFSIKTFAFNCYMTMVKDSCWTNYTLTVSITDASNNASLAQVVVPSGTAWSRITFPCDKGQTLALFAQFEPVIWEGDKGKVYPGQRYWKLPDAIESGISGWNVTVCYPQWFANVPTPPTATGHCQCNTDNIPQLPPVKLSAPP